MARPTFGAGTRSSIDANTALTAVLPSHSTNDLIIIIAHANRNDTTITINEGYTALFAAVSEANTRPVTFRAFAKIATSGSETNPVVTFGASGNQVCDAIVFSGTSLTIGDIVSVTTIADGTEQSDVVFPSASVSTTDSVAVRYCGASDDNQVVTPPAAPSGHTIIVEGEGGGGQWYMATMRVDADPATLGSATWSSIWASFATTEVGSECTIIIPPPSSNDPAITDVDTDEDIDDKQTGVVITGTDFEASQGTGKVEISDNATYGSGTVVLQDETAWADTSITITADIGAMAPGLIRYVWVTNNTGDRNATGFQVRFRRAQAIRMIASGNIAVSGENTTQRLVTPSGKAGGDFDGGRIQDDENPTDTINPTLDGFIEHEWCIEAKPDANLVQYQFRVLIGGVVPAVKAVLASIELRVPAPKVGRAISG